MLRIVKIKGFIISSMFLFAAVSAFSYCEGYTGQTMYDYRDGVCWAYYCTNGSPNWLGSVSSASCAGKCSPGTLQYKPSDSCGTTSRVCCPDGNYSAWGAPCPDPSASCTSAQCWNGYSCTSQPTGKQYNGKCYYTCNSWVCNKGSGWNCTNKVPEKTQGGTWVTWGDTVYYNSAPTTTCSTKVKDYIYGGSSDAVRACSIQVASVRGIPEGIVVDATDCVVIGNCWCVNYGSYEGNGQSLFNCSTRLYKCQTRSLKCTINTAVC